MFDACEGTLVRLLQWHPSSQEAKDLMDKAFRLQAEAAKASRYEDEADFFTELPEDVGPLGLEETYNRVELSVRMDFRRQYGDSSHPSGFNKAGRDILDMYNVRYSDPQAWEILRTVG